jgi:hypothetical protein
VKVARFSLRTVQFLIYSRLAGRDKEAKETVAQLQKVYPSFTVQSWLGIHWSDDPTFNAQYQRIVEGLRKAGVPVARRRQIEQGARPPAPSKLQNRTLLGP